jgi:hypothetical protein
MRTRDRLMLKEIEGYQIDVLLPNWRDIPTDVLTIETLVDLRLEDEIYKKGTRIDITEALWDEIYPELKQFFRTIKRVDSGGKLVYEVKD